MPKASRDSLNAKGKRDAYTFDPEDLVIVTDEKSPLYDERVALPIDENLVLNIMFAPDGVPQGVLEPINAIRNPETGAVEVIDGRQRVKAAREANRRLRKQGLEPVWVPAMLKRVNAHTAMGMLISSNEHRQNDTPLGKAKKAQRYMALGRDETEVATLLGISRSSVKNLLSLLDAPAAVRTAVESGSITASDGYKLAKLSPAEAREKVAELKEKAPRTPGKRRSKTGKKAREILGGSEKPAPSAGTPEKAIEDAAANDIAAWLERQAIIGPGLSAAIAKRIRAGEWRLA